MNAFNKLKHMSFRLKALLGILGITFVSAFAVDLISIELAERSIMTESKNRFQALRLAKSEEMVRLFKGLSKDASSVSSAKFTQDALVAYESIAYGIGVDLDKDSDLHTSKYYENIETRYQEVFDEYVSTYDFKNVSVILNNGAVVAQARKDKLISKNVVNGSLKSKMIAKCFAEAKESKQNVLDDLHISYDETLKAYLCSPIISKYDRDGYHKGDSMGVLVAEIDWKVVQEISDFDYGLGETGELFFMGTDGTFRVKPRYLDSDLKQAYMYQSESHTGMTSRLGNFEESWKALNEDVNYLGEDVFTSAAPLEIMGRQWYVVVQASQNEVTAPVAKMSQANLLVLAIFLMISSVIVWYAVRIFSNHFEGRIEDLTQTSTGLASLSDELIGVADAVNSASQEQAASLQQTSTSLDQISTMIQNTKDQAELTEQNAKKCQDQSNQGRSMIDSLTDAISVIKDKNTLFIEDFNQANEKLKSITNLIRDIQKRTEVINDITFQTKLLSFNASVEAARAGEHGKGFAVVAEEIGNLAKTSSTAAAEIDEIIDNSVGTINTIVDETTQRVSSMATDILSSVEQSDSLSMETASIFASLLDSLQSMHQNASNINQATQQQSKGINEITRAAAELNEKTQLNTMAANKTSSFAQDVETQVQVLSRVAEELTHIINGMDKSEALDSEEEGPEESEKMAA